MAVYIYSEQQIESIIRATKRFRLRNCGVAGAVLLAACLVAFFRPEWIFGARQQARIWVMAALFVFVAGPLAETIWRWKTRPLKLAQSLRERKIEVSAEGVKVSGPPSVRQLARTEIQRADEVPWGLYVRSSNRYRWILIPAKIEDFEQVKQEIARMGIPIAQSAIPPNWEEMAGAVVFIGTMLCAIFAHSASVLIANLLISVLVAVAGFLIIGASPDNLPKMRWARFGIFLPVAMTASMLWTAMQK